MRNTFRNFQELYLYSPVALVYYLLQLYSQWFILKQRHFEEIKSHSPT